MAQNWSFNAQSPYATFTDNKTARVTTKVGVSNTVEILVDTKIKDIIGTPLADGFTDFKLVSFLESTGTLGFVMSSVGTTNIYSGHSTQLAYTNGMIGVMKYRSVLSNISTAATGTYLVRGIHQIFGTNALGVQQILAQESFDIYYVRYPSATIFASPDELYFTHFIGEALPNSKSTYIIPGAVNTNWLLTAHEDFVLTSPSGAPYLTIGTNSSGKPIITSSDTRTVNIALGSAIASVTTPGTTSYNFTLTQPDKASTIITVHVEHKFSVTVSPPNLDFIHIQNGDTTTLPIAITGNLWKVVAKPNFILTSPTSGVTITTVTVSGIDHQEITGSGDAIINTTLSEYYDSDVPFTAEDLASSFDLYKNNVQIGIIPFTVSNSILSNFLVNPYPEGQMAFTLDNKFFEFFSSNMGTYLQFDATIKTYDFFTNVEKSTTISQKMILFQGTSKTNLGKIIHRLIPNFSLPNINYLQYKPAILKVNCTEKLIADDSEVRSGISDDISFVAGLSRGTSAVGFLDFNIKPNRVTKNGFCYLNMLVPIGNFQLQIYKNGEIYTNLNLLPSAGNVMFKRYYFVNFSQGDVIDTYLILEGGSIDENTPKKRFIVFPNSNYSHNIVWENEFLLQSVLECTGTASIKSDFEFLSQKVYQDLVEKLEYLASNKEVKLSVNTGWLMKTDIDTIESLMRSKRVWLLGAENISLRPIAKTMINDDLERELIEFSLEFTINRNYDEETYSL